MEVLRYLAKAAAGEHPDDRYDGAVDDSERSSRWQREHPGAKPGGACQFKL